MMKILFLGDVFAKIGRKLVASELPKLKQKYAPDITIINGENAAGGLGIDKPIASELFKAGADVITSGNHIWNKREGVNYLKETKDPILRPYNYPPGAPGKGYLIWDLPNGKKIAVVNMIGRVFMGDILDCPFQAIDSLLKSEIAGVDYCFIDFHAEATSEKVAFGFYVDGRVTAVVGTHTHVQTADERILPGGTAHITDVGMCGPYNSVIGVKTEKIIDRFISGLPMRFDAAKGAGVLCGVIITGEETTGKATTIERIRIVEQTVD